MNKKKDEKKFDESLISAVYAGPEEMGGRIPDFNEADIEEVYAGPEEMNLVYAGPEDIERFHVKETFTNKVYAGPDLMRRDDQDDEIFKMVYAGPPRKGFFRKIMDKLAPGCNNARPYPENYADKPEVAIPENDLSQTPGDTIVCPLCGKTNDVSAKFCIECGAPLKKNPPTANM